MQIGMLGPLEIRADDGEVIELPGARLRALLIALALEPGRAVPKTTLVDWIWGEQPPADAINALQALVSRLRRVLPDGSLDAQPGGYRLTVAPDAVDVVRFERLLDRARDGADARRAELLCEGLALWRGAALQDGGPGDEAAAQITRLEGLRLVALEDRYEAELRLGRGPELVAELTELVARNPVRERLIGALMRALAVAGRGVEALVVYQNAREALADTFGVDPSPELSDLHVALLRGEVGAEPDRRTNLRAELTEFVGGHSTVAAVRELIAGHRLTTLTGPGGSGKTRLAVETAQTLLVDLPDGAWLVELAPVSAGGEMAQAALAAFGLRDALLGTASNAEPMDRLIAAIRDREALLILDNCEHVIESAAAFAQRILGECRRLRILATSREPLGITGEALWQVEPLGLPAAQANSAEIAAAPAVRLLRERAGAVRQDLAADDAALTAMARICRALDGIPLAIELAAARLRTMSLEQLATRLDEAAAVVTEVGTVEDLVVMRSRQAQLYRLAGDDDSSAAALAQAEQHAVRSAWPSALAELALAKAELARWSGDTAQAYEQIAVARAQLGVEAEEPNIAAVLHSTLGRLAADPAESRKLHGAALKAAAEAGHAALVAHVLIGIADLALREERDEQAAMLLAAAIRARGLPDGSQPDISRIERMVRQRLGDDRFTGATRRGAQADPRELAETALAGR